MGGLEKGDILPTKSGPSMASGPTVAAMFDSLQRTLASRSGIFMIDTCPLLLKRISLIEFAPLGVLNIIYRKIYINDG